MWPRKRKSTDTWASFEPEKKRPRLDKVLPLDGTVSLIHLAVLHRALGRFCIAVKRGLAIPEMSCDICSQPSQHEVEGASEIDRYASEGSSLTEQEKFRVYMLLREMCMHGGIGKLHLEEVEDSVFLDFQELNHLSWLAIQLLLFSSPVVRVECDLTSQTMKAVCMSRSGKCGEEGCPRDNILRQIVLKHQRSVLQHVSRTGIPH